MTGTYIRHKHGWHRDVKKKETLSKLMHFANKRHEHVLIKVEFTMDSRFNGINFSNNFSFVQMLQVSK